VTDVAGYVSYPQFSVSYSRVGEKTVLNYGVN
jgi:hypothetical protein